ncbi:MAG TPA: type II toxin-antitoxin system RelE/ParE family toxin [Roseiarcus sp.]
MPKSIPITGVEVPEFLSLARKLWSEEEHDALVDYVAYNPTAGDLMVGTGGLRKLRWAMAGRGKSGGARIIYYYHNVDVPLFLLTVYAKNDRADIRQAERNAYRDLVAVLVETYPKKGRSQ